MTPMIHDFRSSLLFSHFSSLRIECLVASRLVAFCSCHAHLIIPSHLPFVLFQSTNHHINMHSPLHSITLISTTFALHSGSSLHCKLDLFTCATKSHRGIAFCLTVWCVALSTVLLGRCGCSNGAYLNEVSFVSGRAENIRRLSSYLVHNP